MGLAKASNLFPTPPLGTPLTKRGKMGPDCDEPSERKKKSRADAGRPPGKGKTQGQKRVSFADEAEHGLAISDTLEYGPLEKADTISARILAKRRLFSEQTTAPYEKRARQPPRCEADGKVKRLRDVDDTVHAKRAKRAGSKRALENRTMRKVKSCCALVGRVLPLLRRAAARQPATEV